MTPNSTFFSMDKNGMTAYTPDGTFVGVSQPVPKENGLLTFKSGIVNLLPVKAAQVYYDLVSCELAGFSTRKSNFETHQSESTDAYGDDTYPSLYPWGEWR